MQDLRKRRVAPAVAETAAREAFAEVDEAAQAKAFLERKYRSKDLAVFLREEKNAAQAYRRLRVAGFGSGTAIRVLRTFTPRADELESIEESADPSSPEA
jgi:regulatory protein